MIDKFTEVYLNIITEAFYRYDYNEVLIATLEVTNEGKDPWVKGETGVKVLQQLKNVGGPESLGGREIFTDKGVSGSHEYWKKSEAEEDRLYELTKYIVSYWTGRKNSGSQFDINLYNIVSKAANIDGRGTNNMTAPEVGQVAYAIWKALNARINKLNQNAKSIQDSGIDLEKEFPIGKKFENLTLKLKDIKESTFSQGRYASNVTYILVCEDPASDLGFKYNVRLSNSDINNNLGIKLFKYLQELQKMGESIENLGMNIEFETASISRVDAKWKVITLNRAKVLKPTLQEIEEFNAELEDRKFEEQNKKWKEEERKQQEKEQIIAQTMMKDMEPICNDEEKIREFFKEYIKMGRSKVGTIYARSDFHLLWRAFMKNYKELTGKEFKL